MLDNPQATDAEARAAAAAAPPVGPAVGGPGEGGKQREGECKLKCPGWHVLA